MKDNSKLNVYRKSDERKEQNKKSDIPLHLTGVCGVIEKEQEFESLYKRMQFCKIAFKPQIHYYGIN